MREAFTGEADEIWGCSRTYEKQRDFSRYFFLDHPGHLSWDIEQVATWTREVNSLKVPVYMLKHFSEVPLSLSFPLQSLLGRFPRGRYSSTIAYMVAFALFEGFDKIILHKILEVASAGDYSVQKPCLDYWCGIADGMGIDLDLTSDSLVAKPMPWQSEFYGYQRREKEWYANHVYHSGIVAAMRQQSEPKWIYQPEFLKNASTESIAA